MTNGGDSGWASSGGPSGLGRGAGRELAEEAGLCWARAGAAASADELQPIPLFYSGSGGAETYTSASPCTLPFSQRGVRRLRGGRLYFTSTRSEEQFSTVTDRLFLPAWKVNELDQQNHHCVSASHVCHSWCRGGRDDGERREGRIPSHFPVRDLREWTRLGVSKKKARANVGGKVAPKGHTFAPS